MRGRPRTSCGRTHLPPPGPATRTPGTPACRACAPWPRLQQCGVAVRGIDPGEEQVRLSDPLMHSPGTTAAGATIHWRGHDGLESCCPTPACHPTHFVALAAERHEVRPSEDETAAVDRLSERRDAQLRHQRQSPAARSVHLPGEVHTTPGPGTGRTPRRFGASCWAGWRKVRVVMKSSPENPTDSKWWRLRGCCRHAERGATAAIRGRFRKVVADSGEVFGQSVDRGANVPSSKSRRAIGDAAVRTAGARALPPSHRQAGRSSTGRHAWPHVGPEDRRTGPGHGNGQECHRATRDGSNMASRSSAARMRSGAKIRRVVDGIAVAGQTVRDPVGGRTKSIQIERREPARR